jgi:hypothetical protein
VVEGSNPFARPIFSSYKFSKNSYLIFCLRA